MVVGCLEGMDLNGLTKNPYFQTFPLQLSVDVIFPIFFSSLGLGRILTSIVLRHPDVTMAPATIDLQ